MDDEEFGMMLFLFKELPKKVVRRWKNSEVFGYGNYLKISSFFVRSLIYVKPLEKTRGIDNEARVSKKVEMKIQ